MTTTRPDPTVAAIVQQLATLDHADLSHDQPGLFV
jgi:hypothetical protein